MRLQATRTSQSRGKDQGLCCIAAVTRGRPFMEIIRTKYLKLSNADYARLEALRAGRSWAEFIATIEGCQNKTCRNPLPLPFMKNVKALNLNFSEVCLVCHSRSNLPEKLIEIDYAEWLFTTFKDIFDFAGLDLEGVRARLTALNMRQVVPACPVCHSYEGKVRPEDVLWDVLYYTPALSDESPAPVFKLKKLEPNKK